MAKNLFFEIKKLIFLTIGLICLVLGILGYILPGLPGTIFLIISVACFIRSSEKLYKFVINNRIFGKLIRDYRESKAMPKKAKIISISMIWIFSLFSVFCIPFIPFCAPYGWEFKIPILLLALIGTIYISKIKSIS